MTKFAHQRPEVPPPLLHCRRSSACFGAAGQWPVSVGAAGVRGLETDSAPRKEGAGVGVWCAACDWLRGSAGGALCCTRMSELKVRFCLTISRPVGFFWAHVFAYWGQWIVKDIDNPARLSFGWLGVLRGWPKCQCRRRSRDRRADRPAVGRLGCRSSSQSRSVTGVICSIAAPPIPDRARPTPSK